MSECKTLQLIGAATINAWAQKTNWTLQSGWHKRLWQAPLAAGFEVGQARQRGQRRRRALRMQPCRGHQCQAAALLQLAPIGDGPPPPACPAGRASGLPAGTRPQPSHVSDLWSPPPPTCTPQQAVDARGREAAGQARQGVTWQAEERAGNCSGPIQLRGSPTHPLHPPPTPHPTHTPHIPFTLTPTPPNHTNLPPHDADTHAQCPRHPMLSQRCRVRGTPHSPPRWRLKQHSPSAGCASPCRGG